MSSAIPHFIICGAPRAGTTWLVEALLRHPGVYMARPIVPEPKFFHIDAIYAKGMDHYLDTWFKDVPPGAVAGEKDTYYLENPETAGRIHAHLPEVKLVFILREPGARAFSNYKWSKQHGHEPESFLRAMDLEEQRERDLEPRLKFVRPHAYLSRGLYADQLKPYFEHFRREQMLFLNFEAIIRTPGPLLAKVHEFLGVEPRPGDADGLGDVNAAVDEDHGQITAQERNRLNEFYAEPNERLFALLGPEFERWQGEHQGAAP